jgi:hypothetical protein
MRLRLWTRESAPRERLEEFAVQLWEIIGLAETHFGAEVERARLLEAAECMHGARMVLTGAAKDDAHTLCELAWARLAQLDRQWDDISREAA